MAPVEVQFDAHLLLSTLQDIQPASLDATGQDFFFLTVAGKSSYKMHILYISAEIYCETVLKQTNEPL